MLYRGNEKGFSIMEVMFYGAIVSVSGILVAKLLRQPQNISVTIAQAAQQQMADRSTALPLDDIKCAWGTSIQWNAIDASHPSYDRNLGPTVMPWFQVHNLPGQATPYAYVCYAYRASDSSIVREYSLNAPADPTQCTSVAEQPNGKETIIAQQVEPPTAATPLFLKDPAATDVVVFSLKFKVPLGAGKNFKPITIVRRAHVRS